MLQARYRAKMMQSISLSNLEKLIQELVRQMKSDGREPMDKQYSSEDLRMYFRSQTLWPPEKYPQFFSDKMPAVALTYMWRGTSIEHLAQILRSEFPNQDELTIWIDIFFNDQNVDDLSTALAIAERIYMGADEHAVILAIGKYPTYDDYGEEVKVGGKPPALQ